MHSRGAISKNDWEHNMQHSNTFRATLTDFRDSPNPELKKVYEHARNKGLDDIAVAVKDRVKRLRSWSAKKGKLV